MGSISLTESDRLPSVTSLLPLFSDQAKSVAMIKHGMNMVRRAMEYLNLGHTRIIAADQPQFAVAKQVQWQSPNLHGESSFVIMMGGLHIEMAYLKVLGQWLERSGWVASLVDAGLVRSGTADSFLKATHVTRTQRAHEITACALEMLLTESYQVYLRELPQGKEPSSMESWSTTQTDNHSTFKY